MEPSANTPTISMQCQYSQFGTSPNGQTSPSDNTTMKLGPSGYYSPQPSSHGMPGLPQAPRQKGRPRKRKPKDIEAMTASLGMYKAKANKSFLRWLGHLQHFLRFSPIGITFLIWSSWLHGEYISPVYQINRSFYVIVTKNMV